MSKQGLEVDKAKIIVIEKLSSPCQLREFEGFWVMLGSIRDSSRICRRSQGLCMHC